MLHFKLPDSFVKVDAKSVEVSKVQLPLSAADRSNFTDTPTENDTKEEVNR